MLIVDDISRFMWIKVLPSKDVATTVIKQYQAAIETETRRKLRAFRSDRGSEFTSTQFVEHCVEDDVQ
jgi:transposase InsO family protein